tara:strand:+ start:761 stop:1378 length:618 start_codon:yes stop_codon:yes gene_type:complete
MNKCKECNKEFVGRKEIQKFCSKSCASKHTARNRNDSWRPDNRGTNNPMYGKPQTNPNSLANLERGYWKGKTQCEESNKKRSEALTGITRSKETKHKIRKTKIAKGQIFPPDHPHYSEFKKYRRKVHYWSEKNDLSCLKHYDKRSLKGYHLDHKYSIIEGFRNNVPPKVIGNIHNLEFLYYKDNCVKGTKCSMTLEELLCLTTRK